MNSVSFHKRVGGGGPATTLHYVCDKLNEQFSHMNYGKCNRANEAGTLSDLALSHV